MATRFGPSIVPGAYNRPGTAPTGSDFVRLRDAAGMWLGAGDITSVDLTVAPTLDCRWTIGDGALYSGSGNGILRRMARDVSLPAGVSTIDFDARWDPEEGWDFGYVQVSVDGGETSRSSHRRAVRP